MSEATPDVREAESAARPVRHIDVLIVGAGLSGIGAAHHLRTELPDKSLVILEGRERLGGTWDLFRYPGVRSDSDMYTLGYRFRPWTERKAIADGPSILRYIEDTAREGGIEEHIRFGHHVKAASWSSVEARWTIEAEQVDAHERVRFTCNWLHMCSGYYDYAQGYLPGFPGADRFGGRIVHPQFWPDDLDYKGKRVVVIGSGATAVTIVPEMARDAAHVVMLQRSPTYMVSRPSEDAIATRLQRLLPARASYRLTRWKNVLLQMFFFNLARRRPDKMKQGITDELRKLLPADYDVATHFTPRYNPWDQRLCLVPDGNMFEAISDGRASIVTGEIETFTEGGIRLKPTRSSRAQSRGVGVATKVEPRPSTSLGTSDEGEGSVDIPADVIVTATGLKIQLFSDIAFTIDGAPRNLSSEFAYRGMMFSDVPNFSYTFGYTNASWTLKADLTAGYLCRLLRHMERKRYAIAMPRREPDLEEVPFLDFSSGYVQRARDILPKQASKQPWRVHQNYVKDIAALRFGRIDDGIMTFRRAPA